MKKKKKILLFILFIASVCFFILEGMIIFHKDSFSPEKSDAGLILGYSLSEGVVPGAVLEQRLQKGLLLYEAGYFDYFIVSGGQGPKDKLPVAQAMKQWLVFHGVPEQFIIEEIESKNTYENMKYSFDIFSAHNFQSLIVITSDFHIYRSMLMADDFFWHITGAACDSNINTETFLLYLKEPFSLLKYYLFLK